MKKTLSLILALAMIMSLFAGLTVTASADYSGTGTFTKAVGTLESGYYVFTYATETTMFPMSNDTSGNNWILPGADFPLTDTVEDPDPSVVWYYDASTGTVNSAGDPTLFVSWPTAGNSAKPTTTATPLTIEDTGDGVYEITVTATPERMLRYNTQSAGWRFYTSNTGKAEFTILKLDDGETPVHEHDWSGWTPNEDGTHSRTCQAADCPIGTQTEACSFEDSVATEPTCGDEGELLHTCTVCGYMYGEAIPATGEHTDEDGDGFCDVCGQEMPEIVVYTLGTELHEGDQLVIWSVSGNVALSTTASGTKLKGVSANIDGEELTITDNSTAVLTVEFADAQNFCLKTAEGKYLTTGATGNSLSLADAADDYSLWYLASAGADTVYIHNLNASYNGRAQALEFYNKLFTAYSANTTAAYQFQLFIHANPDAHIHSWDEGTVTREPSCTEKGVMTYSCTGCDETYTEDIPMIPHADGDGDGLCDACEGRIYSQAETLNDGDSLILVTGAFGVAMTGTASGSYMAAAEINAQAGVTVPVAEDNVWTVKTAEEGFYLINNAGQYLCVNESNKLALGDEDSSNILWTVGESVDGLEPTGTYLFNPGSGRYLEYGKNYNNYQTYTAPTADYETCYAFTFYTLPAHMASYSLAPTEFTLAGAGYTDIECSFTSLVLGLIDVGEGETAMATSIDFYMNGGTLTNADGGTIPFLVDDPYHIGAEERMYQGNSFSDPEETVIMAVWIDPEVYADAAPGTYTGTFTYESEWEVPDDEMHYYSGEPGSIELTLVVPEPEPLDDGYYLLIAHGEDDWVIRSVDPANKFEPNPDNGSEWLLSTTLAVEDQIKVVRIENNAITGWWPNAAGTQYHVDEAHAGEVNIYFKTDYVGDWSAFGGYFYIAIRTYTVTLGAFEGGRVSADKETAAKGETVTLTVTPAAGKQLKELYYIAAGSEEQVPIEKNEDEAYCFEMPGADLEVFAVFEDILYTVTVSDSIENGTVSADKETAVMGETVTLTVTPEEGWELASLTRTTDDEDHFTDITDKDEDGNYFFKMPAGNVSIMATFQPIPVTLEEGFYLLIGHGDDGWGLEFINPEQKFELNGSSQDEWLLSTTLAEEDEIKVVRVENNAITGWWPDGAGTQYHVDAAHAGNVTIYFKTNYVNDWSEFGGYFYIGSLLKPDYWADVYGCSVSLKGSIALNFYLIPSEALFSDGNAYVLLGETKILFSEAGTRTVGEDTLYQFNVNLHAKQMNDVVTLRVFDGEGNAVALYRHSNNEDLTETGFPYSVHDYIETVRETGDNPKLIALVNAMADYGILAQLQFNYNTENLPEVQGDLDAVTADDLASFAAKVTEGAAEGLSYFGTSLLLQSETIMRVYFTPDEGAALEDFTFKVGTKKVTAVEADGRWCVEIPNISAKDLDKVYTVKVTCSAGTVVTVKTCALSYAYSVLNAEETPAATLVDLVKGLYLYNKAADAYFG